MSRGKFALLLVAGGFVSFCLLIYIVRGSIVMSVRNFVIVLMLLIAGTPSDVPAQKEYSEPLNRKIEINLDDIGIWPAVQSLAIAGVAIGFEQPPGFDTGGGPRIVLSGGELGDVLDRMVAQDPRFRWELRNDVIQIFPARDRSELIQELLNAEIGPIQLIYGGSKLSILEQLEAEPNLSLVRSRFPQSKVSFFLSYNLENSYRVNKNIKFDRMDLRTAMDRLVTSGHFARMWNIAVSNDERLVSIQF